MKLGVIDFSNGPALGLMGQESEKWDLTLVFHLCKLAEAQLLHFRFEIALSKFVMSEQVINTNMYDSHNSFPQGADDETTYFSIEALLRGPNQHLTGYGSFKVGKPL